jgi:hypothetical protein
MQNRRLTKPAAAILVFLLCLAASRAHAQNGQVGNTCSTIGQYTIASVYNPAQTIICNSSNQWALVEGVTSTGLIGIGSTSPRAILDLSQNTGAMIMPIGTTGQEPASPVNGMIRYNSSIPDLEAYIGSAWTTLTTGVTSGGINFGTSASVTNPSVTGDATTGLFSPAASTVNSTLVAPIRFWLILVACRLII